MLSQIISKAFLESSEIIGQSLTTSVFCVLSVVLTTILVWRRGGLMKDHRKKLLETIGIAMVAWLPFFVWQLGCFAETLRHLAVRHCSSGSTGRTAGMAVAGSSRSLRYKSVPFGRGTLSVESI
jgi:hypothetical protein